MNLIIKIIKKFFPWLPYLFHYSLALVDHIGATKKKYSQFGEDKIISDLLSKRNLLESIYIDIGANHPTKLSNTYLLYRHGVSGIVIEPNGHFRLMYTKFRPRDVFIQVGCGSEPDVLPYNRIEGSVSHTFCVSNTHDYRNSLPGSIEYLPILPLDIIVNSVDIPHEWICLLSIDTEGFDVSVVKGSVSTLQKVYLVCIEANEESSAKELCIILENNNFRQIARTGCNLIFENKSPMFQHYL